MIHVLVPMDSRLVQYVDGGLHVREDVKSWLNVNIGSQRLRNQKSWDHGRGWMLAIDYLDKKRSMIDFRFKDAGSALLFKLTWI